VMVKVIGTRLAGDPKYRSRFHLEGEIGLRMEHPNVVRTLDVALLGDRPCIVLEHVSGLDLGRILEERRRLGSGGLAEPGHRPREHVAGATGRPG